MKFVESLEQYLAGVRQACDTIVNDTEPIETIEEAFALVLDFHENKGALDTLPEVQELTKELFDSGLTLEAVTEFTTTYLGS